MEINNHKYTLNLINNKETENLFDILKHINSYTTFNDFIIHIKNDKDIFTKLLIKCGIDIEIFFIIMNFINKEPGKYHKIYCNEYKLIMIFQLEDDFNKWVSLTKTIFYSPKNNSFNHYKAIHSQYLRWCRKNIFKKAFDSVVPYENINIVKPTNNVIIEYEKNRHLSKKEIGIERW